jgi:hypothetical protein
MSGTSLTLPRGSQESAVIKTRDDLLEVNMDLLERKAVRRIDYTVLPIITIFYLLCFLVSAPASLNSILALNVSSRIEQISVTKILYRRSEGGV